MTKPAIHPTADNKLFWQGCEEGILRYQQCIHCETVQLIPRRVCTQCHSRELDWKTSAGYGQILSHTTVYRAPTPAFREDAPYVIVLINLDEGFRLMAQVRSSDASLVSIDGKVRIGFRNDGTQTLPVAEVLTT